MEPKVETRVVHIVVRHCQHLYVRLFSPLESPTSSVRFGLVFQPTLTALVLHTLSQICLLYQLMASQNRLGSEATDSVHSFRISVENN